MKNEHGHWTTTNDTLEDAKKNTFTNKFDKFQVHATVIIE